MVIILALDDDSVDLANDGDQIVVLVANAARVDAMFSIGRA